MAIRCWREREKQIRAVPVTSCGLPFRDHHMTDFGAIRSPYIWSMRKQGGHVILDPIMQGSIISVSVSIFMTIRHTLVVVLWELSCAKYSTIKRTKESDT